MLPTYCAPVATVLEFSCNLQPEVTTKPLEFPNYSSGGGEINIFDRHGDLRYMAATQLYNVANTIGDNCKDVRNSRVNELLTTLGTNINLLDDALMSLGNRLEIATGTSPCEVSTPCGNPRPMQSQLASAIEDACDRVETLRLRVLNMRDGLEI